MMICSTGGNALSASDALFVGDGRAGRFTFFAMQRLCLRETLYPPGFLRGELNGRSDAEPGRGQRTSGVRHRAGGGGTWGRMRCRAAGRAGSVTFIAQHRGAIIRIGRDGWCSPAKCFAADQTLLGSIWGTHFAIAVRHLKAGTGELITGLVETRASLLIPGIRLGELRLSANSGRAQAISNGGRRR